MNSGNACYHFVQDLWSSSLLSKIYRTIILSVVLNWCETWSLTLREGHRLRVFENGLLRKIFGSKRNELAKGVEKATQSGDSWSVLLIKYYSRDKNKKRTMGRESSIYGG